MKRKTIKRFKKEKCFNCGMKVNSKMDLVMNHNLFSPCGTKPEPNEMTFLESLAPNTQWIPLVMKEAKERIEELKKQLKECQDGKK